MRKWKCNYCIKGCVLEMEDDSEVPQECPIYLVAEWEELKDSDNTSHNKSIVQCAHEWIEVCNEKVSGVEFCTVCHELRPRTAP